MSFIDARNSQLYGQKASPKLDEYDYNTRNVILPELKTKHGTPKGDYNSTNSEFGIPELQPVIALNA